MGQFWYGTGVWWLVRYCVFLTCHLEQVLPWPIVAVSLRVSVPCSGRRFWDFGCLGLKAEENGINAAFRIVSDGGWSGWNSTWRFRIAGFSPFFAFRSFILWFLVRQCLDLSGLQHGGCRVDAGCLWADALRGGNPKKGPGLCHGSTAHQPSGDGWWPLVFRGVFLGRNWLIGWSVGWLWNK